MVENTCKCFLGHCIDLGFLRLHALPVLVFFLCWWCVFVLSQMMILMMKPLTKTQQVLRIILHYGNLQPWSPELAVPKQALAPLPPALVITTNTQKNPHPAIPNPPQTMTDTQSGQRRTIQGPQRKSLSMTLTDTMTRGHMNSAKGKRKQSLVQTTTKGTAIQHALAAARRQIKSHPLFPVCYTGKHSFHWPGPSVYQHKSLNVFL